MRKVLTGILAFIICSLSIISYAQQANLQEEQEQLKDKIEQSTSDLENVQDELSENLVKIQELDERIASSQQEISGLDDKISQFQEVYDKVNTELDNAENNYNSQKETLEKRLVAMYEAGETEYLDVILSSKSISEFLSNYFLVSEMAEYDAGLLQQMSDRKNYINEIKEKVEAAKKELTDAKQAQITTAKILENTKKIKESYTAQLSEQEKEIQLKIDEYNQRFEEINKQILELAKNGIDSEYIGGVLAWPVPGYTTISSKYGMRTHPITGVYKLHTGTDISAPMGANFIAANDGIVTKASYNSAYGNMVMIDHGGGISTLYAHGSQILVEEGQYVRRGEQVLKVGSTGYSTGPHAHFEVRINGVVTDPMPYITNGLIPTNEGQIATPSP